LFTIYELIADGAAVIYTNALSSHTQTRLLVEYVAHRLSGIPFTRDAEVLKRDHVFIPAGWGKKIGNVSQAM
jgi:transcriptional regulator of met regulon